jgi:hypothetical protein
MDDDYYYEEVENAVAGFSAGNLSAGLGRRLNGNNPFDYRGAGS